MRTVTSYRWFEERIVGWAQKYGHFLLRISFGVIFIWFGLPKVLGTSPTAQLIGGVVPIFPPEVFVVVLGGCAGRYRGWVPVSATLANRSFAVFHPSTRDQASPCPAP